MQSSIVTLTKSDPLWSEYSRLNKTVASWLPFLLGAAATYLALELNGTILWFVAACSLGYGILCEPRFGLYSIAIVIAADAAVFDRWTASFAILYKGIPGALATPVELLILWTCLAWIVRSLNESHLQLPSTTLLYSSLVLTLLLLLGIVNGVSSGGDLTIAIWETRALLVVPALILLTCGLLREWRHVFELAFVVLGALGLMTLQLLWRYLTLVEPKKFTGPVELAFNHDGAMLVGVLATAGAAAMLWGPHKKAKLLGLATCVIAIAFVLMSRRRAALVGIEVGLIILGIVLLITNWRRFVLIAPVVIVISAMYIAAFWNSTSFMGQGARVFRTTFISESVDERDKSSDEYRRIETANLWLGIKSNPIKGHGFGVAYEKPIPLTDLSWIWPFWDYIPHNTILWLWHKGGVVTFMAFWFLLGTTIAQGVHLIRQTRTPALTAVIGCGVAYLAMTVMYSYVDLGLTSTRPMLLFGICLGSLFALERLWVSSQKAQQAAL